MKLLKILTKGNTVDSMLVFTPSTHMACDKPYIRETSRSFKKYSNKQILKNTCIIPLNTYNHLIINQDARFELQMQFRICSHHYYQHNCPNSHDTFMISEYLPNTYYLSRTLTSPSSALQPMKHLTSPIIYTEYSIFYSLCWIFKVPGG